VIGAHLARRIEFVCSDIWPPYLQLISAGGYEQRTLSPSKNAIADRDFACAGRSNR
jgi:hypothetical protein